MEQPRAADTADRLPDWETIRRGLRIIADELPHIAHTLVGTAQLADVERMLASLKEEVARERDAELQRAVARLDAKLDDLRAAVDANQRATRDDIALAAMRVCNRVSPVGAVLQYPPGVAATEANGFPVTHTEVVAGKLPVEVAKAMAEAMGLLEVPDSERVQQVQQYLVPRHGESFV